MTATSVAQPAPPTRSLVITCGALVRELQFLIAQAGRGDIDIKAIPATYHNRPEKITPAVARRIAWARSRYDRIFVAYGECGTGGELDKLLAREQIERLPGAHCYAFFSGAQAFAARGDADMTSFFLTDFLTRHFQSLVIRGLGLDRHPELMPMYFGNYDKVVYLSQLPTPELIAQAEAAAKQLGLAFEHRPVGFGDLSLAVAH
jgi:hypothetical protein